MYNIAIIGAGQLGSRYLQGLKLADLNMNIEVLDNNEESLFIAKSRYEEVVENRKINSIKFIKRINELSEVLDLVIIATSSAPRCSIVQTLLKSKLVKSLILEKFLFQTEEQSTGVYNLLKQFDLLQHTYVNCTRRVFDGYKKLKIAIEHAQKINMSVSGSNWGLACNSIHYLDFYSFLTGMDINDVNTDLLKSKIFNSKRAGYVEFEGSISSRCKKGGLILDCQVEFELAPSMIILNADNDTYIIDETKGFIIKNGKKWNDIGIKYQSQITGEIAEGILNERKSDLVGYKESMEIHLAFFRPLLAFYNRIINCVDNKILPIT